VVLPRPYLALFLSHWVTCSSLVSCVCAIRFLLLSFISLLVFGPTILGAVILASFSSLFSLSSISPLLWRGLINWQFERIQRQKLRKVNRMEPGLKCLSYIFPGLGRSLRRCNSAGCSSVSAAGVCIFNADRLVLAGWFAVHDRLWRSIRWAICSAARPGANTSVRWPQCKRFYSHPSGCWAAKPHTREQFAPSRCDARCCRDWFPSRAPAVALPAIPCIDMRCRADVLAAMAHQQPA